MNKLEDVNLPKWPQMLVWGKPVSQEQAYDIIVRTDRFLIDTDEFSGGNNAQWNKWAHDVLGFTALSNRIKLAAPDDVWHVTYTVSKRLQELAGYVDTSYVNNNWASCAFIYGPHGWCHPNGKIEFIDNVGKWPDITDILHDWEMLANAFPYLDLTATLMDNEACEEFRKPLVSVRVINGQATLINPVVPDAIPDDRDVSSAIARITSGRDIEQGLPDDWIVQRGVELAPLIDQAFNEAVKEYVTNRQNVA